MAEAVMVRGGESSRVWGTINGAVSTPVRSREHRAGRVPTFNAWLSAEEVALLILHGECAEAGVSVPARFSPHAIDSAIRSVQRWTQEGRIFAIHELYPRYQFDGRGRPHPAVERALAIIGRRDPLKVGNWFASANPFLGGKRPQELIATAPVFVVLALQKLLQRTAN